VRAIKIYFVFLASVFLVACGGGSGGISASVTTASFDLQAALLNEAQYTGSYNISISGLISNSPISGAGVAGYSFMSPGSFEGQVVRIKGIYTHGSVTVNGATSEFSGAPLYYYDASYNLVGALDGYYSVVTSRNSLPTAAKINDSGTWLTLTNYAMNTDKTVLSGSTLITYSLAADSATSAILTLTHKTTLQSGGTQTVTDTYRITTSNGITPLTSTDYQDARNYLTVTFN